MADAGFLQAALSLLGRPGNAVRGALIDGPSGFGQGLSGAQQYDGTQLPGISSLPDEGPSLGPLHLTPRTVAGFAASTALDPLSYVGGFGAGHAGELGGGALSRGLSLMDRVSPPAIAHASELDPLTADLGELVNHINTKHGLNITLDDGSMPGRAGEAPEALASPEQHQASVATARGSLADQSMGDQHYSRVVPGNAQEPPPAASPTPLGDPEVAHAKNQIANYAVKPATVQADQGTDFGKALGAETDHPGLAKVSDPKTIQQLARQYLDYTADSPPDETTNLIQQLHDALSAQLGEGPDSIGGSRGKVLLDQTRKRQDFEAGKTVAQDPSLVQAQAQELQRTSTSSRPGLTAGQMDLAKRKAIGAESATINTREKPWYGMGTPGREATIEDPNGEDLSDMEGQRFVSRAAQDTSSGTAGGRDGQRVNFQQVAQRDPELQKLAAIDMEQRFRQIQDLQRTPGHPGIQTRDAGHAGRVVDPEAQQLPYAGPQGQLGLHDDSRPLSQGQAFLDYLMKQAQQRNAD